MIGKLRQLARFLFMSRENYNQRLGIAFHEAGHSVMGYEHGHRTNYIDINFDDKNGIHPQVDKDFGNDKQIIEEIHCSNINALIARNITVVHEVAQRYCEGLLAGTMAEFWSPQNGTPRFNQINGNDRSKVISCISVLHQLIGQTFNRNDFLNDRLNNTRDFVCAEDNFERIQKVANALMKSKCLRINRQKIEQLI